MLKRFFALFLMTVVLSAQAASTGIKSAIDELNYSLSVEWNQQDEAFKARKLAAFAEQVEALEAAGITHEEMLTEALSLITDKRLAMDLAEGFELIALNKMDKNEASELINEIVRGQGLRGASFTLDSNPKAVVGTLVFVFFFTLLATKVTESVR